jgi:hypothetical protein
MQNPECGHNERIATAIWMLDMSLQQVTSDEFETNIGKL